MGDEVLEATIVKALASPLVRENIEFLFHAGEPLAAGIDFYRRAAELVCRYNKRNLSVSLSIQTNATLIDDDWCDLFQKYGFSLGVSVDGPRFLHDKQRVNWAQKGSFDAVMRGIRKLKEREIAFGAICVLSRESLAHPDEIFSFFSDQGFPSVGFNIEEIESENRTSTMFSDDPIETEQIEAEFRCFVTRFADLWESGGRTLRIREFYEMALFMLRKQRDGATRRVPDETADLGIITVQRNGDMSTYSPEFAGDADGTFMIGNITTSDYDDVLNNLVYRKLRSDVHESIAMCATACPYFDLCGGAFLSNKFWQNGTLLSTETVTCRLTRQAVADVLIGRWHGAGMETAGTAHH